MPIQLMPPPHKTLRTTRQYGTERSKGGPQFHSTLSEINLRFISNEMQYDRTNNLLLIMNQTELRPRENNPRSGRVGPGA